MSFRAPSEIVVVGALKTTALSSSSWFAAAVEDCERLLPLSPAIALPSHPDDWLAKRKEPGQTVAEFLGHRAALNAVPDEQLHLLPILGSQATAVPAGLEKLVGALVGGRVRVEAPAVLGTGSAAGSPTEHETYEFVPIAPPKTTAASTKKKASKGQSRKRKRPDKAEDRAFSVCARIAKSNGRRQLICSEFKPILHAVQKQHATAAASSTSRKHLVMGLVLGDDLFQDDHDLFICGLAWIHERVAVFSNFRYHHNFSYSPDNFWFDYSTSPTTKPTAAAQKPDPHAAANPDKPTHASAAATADKPTPASAAATADKPTPASAAAKPASANSVDTKGSNWVDAKGSPEQNSSSSSSSSPFSSSSAATATDLDGGVELLRRTARLCAHELLHLRQVQHCIYRGCLMNGSGHVAEDVSQPLIPCPVDILKICLCTGLTPRQYLTNLRSDLSAANLTADAAAVAALLRALEHAK